MTKTACVGAGVIGRGCAVDLYDAAPGVAETAREAIAATLVDPETFGLTDDAAAAIVGVSRARDFLDGVGQATILVKKKIIEYALNRLQAAVVTEALHLVGEGVASPADADPTLTKGLGLRGCFMGPFLIGHLNAPGGYRDYMNKYGETYRTIARDPRGDYDWSASVIDAAHSELTLGLNVRDVSEEQAWRDRRLMRLATHLSEAESENPRPGGAI